LQAFDEVVTLDGKRVRRLIDLERTAAPPDGRVDVGLLRAAPRSTGLGTVFVAAALQLRLAAAPGRPIAEALRVTTSDLVVSCVDPGSAADLGGLQVGDRLLDLDGKPLVTWMDTRLSPETDPAGKHTLRVSRGGRELTVTIDLRPETFRDPLGQEQQRYALGAG
jgi:S1-C subfamily serine protease